MGKKRKKRNTKLYASRFIIVFLSIILQALVFWAFIFLVQKRFVLVSYITTIIGVLLLISIINKKQAAVYKLPWFFLYLIFPFGAVMIYLTFGNVKVSKKQMRKYRSVYSEKDEEYYEQDKVLARLDETGGSGVGIAKYLKNATSLPVLDNSTCEYLHSGENFFARLLEEIGKAEKYVFLEYFIIEDGRMWAEIMEILLEKVAKGVGVYVMYDDVGSMKSVSPNYHKKLQAEGIKAKKFHKFVPIVSVSHNNRDHRKIAVIDGKTGFVSGANLSDEYINYTHPFGRWLDSAVMIRGQAVDSLVKLFIQLYNMEGGEELDGEKFIFKDHEKYSDGFIISYGDSPAPIEEDHIGENVYLDIINRADKYVYITTPYLICDTNITDALKTAVKRGVDVRIIVPSVPDKKFIYIMTRHTCSDLLSAGVKIYKYKDGFIHSKNILSDGQTAVVGTINLDYRSFVHHYECGVLMYKSDAVNDLYEDFIRLFDEECEVADKESLKLGFFEKIVKTVLTLFAPLM